jgi:hypothetical protein
VADPLDRLPAGARSRLERFSHALERVAIDDLQGYVVRNRRAEHDAAVATAEAAARDAGLAEPLEAARNAVEDFVLRAYGAAQFRTTWVGLNTAPGLGPTGDRVRVVRSLRDAAAGLVMWDALDDGVRAEVLGRWGELVP